MPKKRCLQKPKKAATPRSVYLLVQNPEGSGLFNAVAVFRQRKDAEMKAFELNEQNKAAIIRSRQRECLVQELIRKENLHIYTHSKQKEKELRRQAEKLLPATASEQYFLENPSTFSVIQQYIIEKSTGKFWGTSGEYKAAYKNISNFLFSDFTSQLKPAQSSVS